MKEEPLGASDVKDTGRLIKLIVLRQATRDRFPASIIDIAAITLCPWSVEVFPAKPAGKFSVRWGCHTLPRLTLGLRERAQEIEFTGCQL